MLPTQDGSSTKSSGHHSKAKTNILLAAETGTGISGSKSFTQRRLRINRLLSPLCKGGCPWQLVPTPSPHAKKLHPYLRKCPRALWRNAVTQLSCRPSRSPPKPRLQLKCCLSFLLALYNQSNSTGLRSSLLSTPFPYKHLLLVFLSACGRKCKRVPRCNKFRSVSQRGLLVAPSRGLLILLLINPC